MKLKRCPVCKEYLNQTEEEEWCSNPECDYDCWTLVYPKNWREDDV